jgi:catechol 2,3-dioxygenase-like lactoylglutathione lyase family enzyme
MTTLTARLAGVELYFDDLDTAKDFYTNTLGLPLQEDQPDHHAMLRIGDGFVCLERKGMENYPSADKAVLFLEVPNVRAALDRLVSADVLGSDLSAAKPWAAVRDPEGHTVLLLQ